MWVRMSRANLYILNVRAYPITPPNTLLGTRRCKPSWSNKSMLSPPEPVAGAVVRASIATVQGQQMAAAAASSSSRAPSHGGAANGDPFSMAVYVWWLSMHNVHRPCTSSKLGSIMSTVFAADHVSYVTEQYFRQGNDLNGGHLIVGISHAANSILHSQSTHAEPILASLFARRMGSPGGGADPPPLPNELAPPPPPPATASSPVGHTLSSVHLWRPWFVLTLIRGTPQHPLLRRPILLMVLLLLPRPLPTLPRAAMLPPERLAHHLRPSFSPPLLPELPPLVFSMHRTHRLLDIPLLCVLLAQATLAPNDRWHLAT